MACCRDAPRDKAVLCIFDYIKGHLNPKIVFDPEYHDWMGHEWVEADWKDK